MSPNAQEIRRCQLRIAASAPSVPFIQLTPEQRMALSGRTFREASLLTGAVAKAIAEDPEVFAGIALDPDELRATQERALALHGLYASLQVLTRRAYEWYLVNQAQATELAQAAIEHLRNRGEDPFCQKDQLMRMEYGLLRATNILLARKERKKRSERRNRRRRDA